MAATKIEKRKRSKVDWMSVSVLFDEVNRLYFSLQRAEGQAQKYEALSEAERSFIFLLALNRATISDLAFMRNLTRQRAQQLVKSLLKKKLLTGKPNRRHASSALYELTILGKKTLMRMMQREKKLYGHLLSGNKSKYESASETLRDVRLALES